MSKLTQEEQKVCAEYSARGEDGLVRCSECPLVIDERSCTCLANVDGRTSECKEFRKERAEASRAKGVHNAWASHILHRFTVAQ